MVDITKERVAEICTKVNAEKDWSDADIESLVELSKDFETEVEFIYLLENLPKVLR